MPDLIITFSEVREVRDQKNFAGNRVLMTILPNLACFILGREGYFEIYKNELPENIKFYSKYNGYNIVPIYE